METAQDGRDRALVPVVEPSQPPARVWTTGPICCCLCPFAMEVGEGMGGRRMAGGDYNGGKRASSRADRWLLSSSTFQAARAPASQGWSGWLPPPSDLHALILVPSRRLLLGPLTGLGPCFRGNAALNLWSRSPPGALPGLGPARSHAAGARCGGASWRPRRRAGLGSLPLRAVRLRDSASGAGGRPSGLRFPTCSGGGAEAYAPLY